jgi:hypothetical protein
MSSSAELDCAYAEAVRIAGPHPNALGFMRRVPGSSYFRKPPAGCVNPAPTQAELKLALQECRLAIRVERWGMGVWPVGF